MPFKHYILNGENEVVECTQEDWTGWWIEARKNNWHIVKQEMLGDVWLSTVFTAIDHSFMDEGPPVMFETMVFCGDEILDGHQARCCTWEEAEQVHEQAVEALAQLGYHRQLTEGTDGIEEVSRDSEKSS